MPHCVGGLKEMRTEGAWSTVGLFSMVLPPQPRPYDLYDELKSTSRN